MRDLDVDTRWDGSRCTVVLRGEARLENVPRLERGLDEVITRGAHQVLIDCTQLGFMDSASTGALLRLRTRLEQERGALVLFGVRPVVQRLLDRTGLSERLPAASDEAAARACLEAD